jgi:hypothetical protein
MVLMKVVENFEDLFADLSQGEKTEALDDTLHKAALTLNDGFLTWQLFVALQNQASLSPAIFQSRVFGHSSPTPPQ